MMIKHNKKAGGTGQKKFTVSVRAKGITRATKSTNMDFIGYFLTPSHDVNIGGQHQG